MKRYKLLKDTPTVKAGTIFEERESPDEYKELGQVVTDGCLTRPWLTVSEIDNFDEWFEEIPEKHERWRGGKCIEYGKNWHAYYDTITKTYHPVHSISYFYPGIIYFRTEEALEKSLKEHEEQWKTVRKYEMGEM